MPRERLTKGFNQYLSDVVNRPEDYGELALAAAHDTGEWWASLFLVMGKERRPTDENWLETYIASGGGSGLGGGTGAGMPGESVPFLR